MMAGMKTADSMSPNTAYRSGVKIVPPSVFAGVFAIGLLLQHFFSLAWPPKTVGHVAALLCFLPAVVLAGWALICFRLVRTSPLPIRPSTTLVTTGPYRLIRNPMYVGFGFLYAGLSLRFQVFWALILLPIAIAIIHWRVIVPEEKYLEQTFGAEYLDYRARVPRWLPRLGL
jgi:protein-S-isoprenylcysteine O-methyltransferase Ste14